MSKRGGLLKLKKKPAALSCNFPRYKFRTGGLFSLPTIEWNPRLVSTI